ncbi:hypothetical protein KZE55_04475 [Limosilactobacillus panis]|uniref:hypothetical protein n=1 Tax=Limosilactobacillus panis TaxID=47493 RepID=UPI001C98A8B4|nr:hypothetical protein [Limosilactobacillus panis]QZN93786.1 hypothetical protein KZE55_04475 [Limosilactobacillus panis]UUF81155.1 hypothetical protein NO935_23675 [Xanthomonas oryzae pv. oryzae]
MTNNEFEDQWSKFMKQFNQAFDTPENQQALMNVVKQNSSSEKDIPLNYEHVYQQQRTNNLVKAAIATFLNLDESN